MEGGEDDGDDSLGRKHDKHAKDTEDDLLLTLLSLLIPRFRTDELEDAPKQDQESYGKGEQNNGIQNVLIDLAEKLLDVHELT